MLSATKQNYWPGFLDILVNVMLYLILLVGTFALGAVSLAMYSMEQQKQLSFFGHDINKAIAGLDVSEQIQSELIEKVESLDVEQVQMRQQELEESRQLIEELLESYQEELQSLSKLESILNQDNVSEYESIIEQLIEKISIVDAEYIELKAQYELLVDSSKQASGEVAVVHNIIDFYVSNRDSLDIHDVDINNDLIIEDLNGTLTAVWEFESAELVWMADKRLPVNVFELDDDVYWVLITYTDINNSRLARESFSRLSSVRRILIDAGVPQSLVQVELNDFPNEYLNLNESISRTVFMVKRNLTQ